MTGIYLAGIDIGTSGSKAAIFDLEGNMISSGYEEYKCTYPKPNWVEQDPKMIVLSAMRASKEAIAKSGIDPKDIISLSISSQRSCAIFIDGEGNTVRPMISWQDNRTNKEVKDIESKIKPEDYYDITGLPNNTTWILSKILWMKKNEPKLWEKVKKIVQLQDFALKMFGADDFYNDLSDAVFFGVFDIEKYTWNDRLIKLFNIDKNMLPKLVPSGTKIGFITEDIAEKTGFSKGTNLCVGAGDQNSASIGAGIIDNGYFSVSIGTAANVITYLDKLYKDPMGKNMITTHAIYGKWQLEGYQSGAASIYRWFRDEIALLEKAYSDSRGLDTFEELNKLAMKAPAGAKGIILLPFLASATAPRWNPNARGTLLGLTFAHDRSCLTRSIIEGITLGVKDMLVSLLNTGIKLKAIRILGGTTESDFWNQIQADMYGTEVETLNVNHAAILGAAILAGVGCGVFKDIREGVSKMVLVNKRYKPIKENVRVYKRLYDIYNSAYKALSNNGVFKIISDFQENP